MATATALHGHRSPRKSPEYISWDSMIARCCRPTHPRYRLYGGRGVRVDPRWRGVGGFGRFLADMGGRPDGTSLDRVNTNGHYTKDNCRWADDLTQRHNRRDFLHGADYWPEEPANPTPWPDLEPQLAVAGTADDWPF